MAEDRAVLVVDDRLALQGQTLLYKLSGVIVSAIHFSLILLVLLMLLLGLTSVAPLYRRG